jgi:hypothetical protein
VVSLSCFVITLSCKGGLLRSPSDSVSASEPAYTFREGFYSSDVHSDLVCRPAIYNHRHIYLTAPDQTPRDTRIDLIKPYQVSLRSGISNLRVDASNAGYNRRQRASETNSGTE